jgi:hypothetical protein
MDNGGSMARGAFFVDPLPQGATPLVRNESDVPFLYAVAEDGQQIIQSPSRSPIPLFYVVSNPSIALASVRERRYALVDRAMDLAAAEIRRHEDDCCVDVLERVTRDPSRICSCPSLEIDSIMDAFAMIEQNDFRVANIYMNAFEYSTVRRWGRDVLDPIGQRNLLQMGIFAHLWGAVIHVTRVVPPGNIYVMAEPQFTGYMPIRQDISVTSADDSVSNSIGWSVSEQIGISCINPMAVARISINRDEQPVERSNIHVWRIG